VPVGYKKKIWKKIFFFASLKSLKKGVGSGVGSRSGSISQRYGSPDPDQHQNVEQDQIEELEGSLARLERLAALEGDVNQLEYLKNVVLNYMLSKDLASRDHMLKAQSSAGPKEIFFGIFGNIRIRILLQIVSALDIFKI
jgi:hypothetical protein